jgi:hypothetical protein
MMESGGPGTARFLTSYWKVKGDIELSPYGVATKHWELSVHPFVRWGEVLKIPRNTWSSKAWDAACALVEDWNVKSARASQPVKRAIQVPSLN